jgi:hypothetical protein
VERDNSLSFISLPPELKIGIVFLLPSYNGKNILSIQRFRTRNPHIFVRFFEKAIDLTPGGGFII